MMDQQMMDRALSYYHRTGKDNFRHDKFALLTRKDGAWTEQEVAAITATFAIVTGVPSQPEHIIVTGGISSNALEHILGSDNFEFYETANRDDPKLPFKP